MLLLTLGCSPTVNKKDVDVLPPIAPELLRSTTDFELISNDELRSKKLFLEAFRVMSHPRCINCHPDGDQPTQGDHAMRHEPPVRRGPQGEGVVGMTCGSCHQTHNLDLARVPGAAHWHLAPKSMAWANKSPEFVCKQLKDPHRNGKRSLQAIIDHVTHDAFVTWAWNPGHGRTPVPGTQSGFVALMKAWVEAGAHCPNEESKL